MVGFFEWVRNMPFEVRLGQKGYLVGLNHILSNKRGSCSSKHYLLGILYERMGLNVVYSVYPFFWRDQDIEFPAPLKKLADKMPMCFHLNISANNFLFDATWDPPLAKAGFTVNEITNMRNGVIVCDEPTVYPNMWQRVSTQKESWTKNNTRWDFYNQLNDWLDSLRK